jgi:glutaredoxin
MKRNARLVPVTAVALLLACAASHAQQVYRSIGPDGKVTFSDRPPAAGAAAPVAGLEPTGSANAALPYELQQAVSRYPVVLYTAAQDCAPCSAAKTLLQQRGVPFSERTIATPEDSDALQKISGRTDVPFATVGGQHLQGFSSTEWTQYLDAAGYPRQSQLPPNYRAAAARPLVEVKHGPATAATSAAQRPAARPPRPQVPNGDPNNPAGIRF